MDVSRSSKRKVATLVDELLQLTLTTATTGLFAGAIGGVVTGVVLSWQTRVSRAPIESND